MPGASGKWGNSKKTFSAGILLNSRCKPRAEQDWDDHGRDGRGTNGRSRPCYGTPCAVTTDRTSAPNKPNLGQSHFEDKCCADKDLQCIGRGESPHKTNPISRSGAPRRCLYCGLRIGDGAASGRLPAPCCRWPAWAGCTNKPNFGHCADPEIGGPRGQLCETNPIWARAIWRTSAVPTRSCDELHAGRASVKQSQFPADGNGSAPTRGPCRRRGRLYKQTQFAGRGRD
jgi:hypothetical protein